MFFPPYGEENQIVLSKAPLQENTDCIEEQDAVLHQDTPLVESCHERLLAKMMLSPRDGIVKNFDEAI